MSERERRVRERDKWRGNTYRVLDLETSRMPTTVLTSQLENSIEQGLSRWLFNMFTLSAGHWHYAPYRRALRSAAARIRVSRAFQLPVKYCEALRHPK